MLATPMTTGDVVIGDTLWATIRGSLYSFGFLVVMVVMGLTSWWWVLLAASVNEKAHSVHGSFV